MKNFRRTILVFFLSLAVMGTASSKAEAAGAEDFYRGKTVIIYVGVSPGGLYSTFAQLMAPHFSRHIPGNPNVIVKHMTGAGGVKALNYVYNVAPKDGTVLMTPTSGKPRVPILNLAPTRYDPAKMHWLGGWGESVAVLTVFKNGPVKTLEEAKKKEVILGSIGKNNTTYQNPTLINNTLGTIFKLITGYRGGTPIRLAMEKGEVDGWCGQWLGWKTRKPNWIREGKLVHLVQLASKRSPDLPDVPLLTDFAKDDEMRAMYELATSGLADRAVVAPPGVPAERLDALRTAYAKMLRDPEFLKSVTKRNYSVYPVSSAEIHEFIKNITSLPPELLAKTKTAMGF